MAKPHAEQPLVPSVLDRLLDFEPELNREAPRNRSQVLRELKQSGLSVVFISHIMEDVLRVADRMVVLKNGRLVGERRAGDTSRDDIVHMMITGRDERRVH